MAVIIVAATPDDEVLFVEQYRVPLGSTQTWKLHNASPVTHFIHIHEERWHTVSRDGHRPPPWLRSSKTAKPSRSAGGDGA